jgi:hypothetical protein
MALTNTPAWTELIRQEAGFSHTREVLAQELVAACTLEDADALTALCRSPEYGVRTAALHLLLYLVVRRDGRIQAATRRQLRDVVGELVRDRYPEVTPRREFPDRRASTLAYQVWIELDTAEAEGFARERISFTSSIVSDSALRFPVDDSTTLVLGPGRIACRLRFEELPFDAGVGDSTVVLARVDVVDAAARAYRGHALVSAVAFAEVLRLSPHAWFDARDVPTTSRLRSQIDYRDYVPMSVPTPAGAEPIVLWGKHLSFDVVLGRTVDDREWLTVRADPDYGRLGGGKIPPVHVAGPWAGRLAFAARILFFSPIDLSEASGGWRELAAMHVQAEWAQPRPQDWCWRRLLERADPKRLEAMVLSRGSEGLEIGRVWNLVDTLRSLRTESVTARLRSLAGRDDALGDHARHVLARDGVGRAERIADLAARGSRRDLWSIPELLQLPPPPAQDDVRDWLGVPETRTKESWLYPAKDEPEYALEVTWTDTVLKYARMVLPQRAWAPDPHPGLRLVDEDEALLTATLPVEIAFEVAGAGTVVVPRNTELPVYVRLERDEDGTSTIAILALAGPDGRAFTIRRRLGSELVLALLTQPHTCLRESPIGAGRCMVDGLHPRWPRPTVLAGLVGLAGGEPGYVGESGFDVGGDVVMEFWRVDSWHHHEVACCLRGVERVDGEPRCDVMTQLPALAVVIVAPWLCELDPARSAAAASWSLSARTLDPNPQVVVLAGSVGGSRDAHDSIKASSRRNSSGED